MSEADDRARCEGKVRHANPLRAWLARRTLQRAARRRRDGKTVRRSPLRVYRCVHCSGYHVGTDRRR